MVAKKKNNDNERLLSDYRFIATAFWMVAFVLSSIFLLININTVTGIVSGFILVMVSSCEVIFFFGQYLKGVMNGTT